MTVLFELGQQVVFRNAASLRPSLVEPFRERRTKERVILRIDHKDRNPRCAAELAGSRDQTIRLVTATAALQPKGRQSTSPLAWKLRLKGRDGMMGLMGISLNRTVETSRERHQGHEPTHPTTSPAPQRPAETPVRDTGHRTP